VSAEPQGEREIRDALEAIELDDTTLDDEAARAAIDALRALASQRDGREVARMLAGLANILERRWFVPAGEAV